MTPQDADKIFEDARITVLTGPPRAYFTVRDSETSVTIRYFALGITGDSEKEAAGCMKSVLQLVASELQDIYPEEWDRIIWWRTPLEFEERDGRPWYYCRLATSPPLSQLFWDRIEKKEGAPFHHAKDF